MYHILYRIYKYLCNLLIGGLFLLPAGRLSAQPLDLYTAVNSAIANYPLIQERTAEVQAGAAHVSTMKGYRLPALRAYDQVNMGTSNGVPGSYFSYGVSTSGSIRAANSSDLASGNIAASELDWDIYNFGYHNSEIKTAEAALDVKKALLKNNQYLVAEKITGLYFDFHKQYRLMSIQTENEKRMATVLSSIRANVRSGLKPGVDSATANAEYSTARLAFLAALNNYTRDKIALSVYTGLDTSRIVPDTSLFSGDYRDKILKLQPEDSITNENPLVNVFQKQYEQQLQENKTISRKFMPRLSLEGAGWLRGSGISSKDVYADNLSDGFGYSRYNYLFGLVLSYNLFDLKHRHDLLREGSRYAEARQQELRTQKSYFSQALLQANASFAIQLQQMEELPKQLSAAQQAYTQQLALYNAGLNTIIDLTNALYLLNTAETNYILAQNDLYQVLFTRAELSDQLDSFLQLFKK